MIGFKNSILINWTFKLILAIGLTPVHLLTETPTDLPLNYPRTEINFYSIPSSNEIPGNNLTINYSQPWDATRNGMEEYLNFNLSIPENPHYCLSEHTMECDPSTTYRTMNGSCNNLIHPKWGTAKECYLRFQPSVYEGLGDFRKSIKGSSLPNLRDITRNIFTNVHRPSPNVSFMFTIYGQTVAHDLSRAQILDLAAPCCPFKFSSHPSCSAIPIRPDDVFYSDFNLTCLPMHRSRSCSHCDTKNREQVNMVTASLDASMVYGTDDSRVMDIRTIDGTGKLILNSTEQAELLPTDKDADKVFCPQKEKMTCFFSGDIRVNQHAALTGITTYYVREHNRIAAKLKTINPHWKEDKLFQESRRILIATLQCITYKEYLPLLLGPRIMDQFNLTMRNGSEGSEYNPHVRLGVRNEFATAAFRLHSMIPKVVGAMNLNFRDIYFNPEIIRAGHMERIMEGVCKVPSEKYDHYYSSDLTNFMAKNPGVPYGNDLSSVDIQRGRDHGLAPYIEMVRFCSEGRVNISNFDHLSPLLMTRERAEMLKKSYGAVEDIDLWVGVQMEHRFPGSEVSPTAACIIAKQFYFVKFGDRFFFEHAGEVPSFTPEQRSTIKQCSLSRLLCDNSNITHVQKNVMLLPSITNPEVPCEEIQEIDLSIWRENP